MGKTVPGIRIQENTDDLLIKIDKQMLIKAFENHPDIHWYVFGENEGPRPVEINNKNAFFEAVKCLMIEEKNQETGISWTGAFLEEVILYLWNEGISTFVKQRGSIK